MCDELQDFFPDSSTYLNQNYMEHHFRNVGDDETFFFFIRTKQKITSLQLLKSNYIQMTELWLAVDRKHQGVWTHTTGAIWEFGLLA